MPLAEIMIKLTSDIERTLASLVLHGSPRAAPKNLVAFYSAYRWFATPASVLSWVVQRCGGCASSLVVRRSLDARQNEHRAAARPRTRRALAVQERRGAAAETKVCETLDMRDSRLTRRCRLVTFVQGWISQVHTDFADKEMADLLKTFLQKVRFSLPEQPITLILLQLQDFGMGKQALALTKLLEQKVRS